MRRILFSLSLGLTLPASGADHDPLSSLAELAYGGDQSARDAVDAALVTAGKDSAKLAALEKRLLGILRQANATFAGRQAAAQRLGLVLALGETSPSADTLKPLGAMLTDERDSDLARLALEPARGEIIDGLFVTALGKSSGRVRLGLIASVGTRRASTAVTALSKLLTDSDPSTVEAAAIALGQIADPAAVAALHAIPEPSLAPIAAAKLAAASRVPPAAALGLLNELQRSAQNPAHRAAAFRQALEIERGSAAIRLAEVLGGRDWTMKQVALEALNDSRAPNLLPTLNRKLLTWDAPTQAAVITALARRGEASATAAIVSSTHHKDAEVRSAAIRALGFLPGTRETAALLARLASESSDQAKTARESLARLNGPDIAAVILAGAERGDPALRAVYLEQLAQRNMTEGLPLLLKTRSDPNPAIRAAAVGALGDLAPASEQKALLDWTIEATDPTEQSRALRSLVNVTLRNPDVAERGRALYGLIEFAQPELVLRLLPALGRIGGQASADSAARLAIREDVQVSDAAVAALTRWPDDTALAALATVAEKAARPDVRTAAIDAALDDLERNRDRWTVEQSTIVSRLLATTQETDVRKRIATLLHRASDETALALANGLKTDPQLGPAFAIAEEVIRANLAGPATLRASSTAGVSNMLDGKTSTRWSTPALGEEWVEVDFKTSRPLTRITLDQTSRAAEFPERYEVFVTDDPQQPGTAVVSGEGQRGNRTVITFPAITRGRYLIVKNIAERKDASWAICELYVE